MDNCYLCGDVLTAGNMHEEHVLQNAIGGTLSPDDILCKACGNKLSKAFGGNALRSAKALQTNAVLDFRPEASISQAREWRT